MDAVRFIVSGRVQGVGFRAWVHSEATRLGIAGSVRNCPDGTVEIIASAPTTSLDRFRALLRQGPPLARVDDVRDSKAAVDPTGRFSIIR